MEQTLDSESSAAESDQQRERERRQDRRVEVDFPVRIYMPVRADGQALELSAGGMRVKIPEDVSHVMHLSLEFELPELDEPIGVIADVRWHKQMGPKSDPRWVCGVRFSDLDEAQSEAVEEYVAGRL